MNSVGCQNIIPPRRTQIDVRTPNKCVGRIDLLIRIDFLILSYRGGYFGVEKGKSGVSQGMCEQCRILLTLDRSAV